MTTVTKEAFDQAAEEAADELNPEWSALELAQWWKRWVGAAGHKRLGRALLAMLREHAD